MIPWSRSIFCLQAAALGDGARMPRGTGVRVSLQEPAGKLAGCHSRWAGQWRLQPTGPRSTTPWGWGKYTDKKIRTRKRSWRSSYKLGRGQIHVTYFVAVVGSMILIQSPVGSLATGFALGWKRDFNFYWNKTWRTTTANAESKWRGTTRLLKRVFRKHCSPCLLLLLTGAMSLTLHQTISCGPRPLCHAGRPRPFSPKCPLHNLLTSFLLPSHEWLFSYLQAH